MVQVTSPQVRSLHVAAILAAGGQGIRFASGGTKTPKQFLELLGYPMYVWSLLSLCQHPDIELVVIVVPSNLILQVQEQIKNLPKNMSLQARVKVVAGGATRQDSVLAGLKLLNNLEPRSDYVLVHDAARPFLDLEIVDAVIKAVIKYGACTVGIPASDTIKEVRDGKIVKTLAREDLFMIQTPQAGKLADLLAAHEQALLKGTTATDDSSLLEQAGWQVRVVQGPPYNLKVTQPVDLILCEALANFLLKDRM